MADLTLIGQPSLRPCSYGCLCGRKPEHREYLRAWQDTSCTTETPSTCRYRQSYSSACCTAPPRRSSAFATSDRTQKCSPSRLSEAIAFPSEDASSSASSTASS